jgi:amidase
MDRLLQRLKAEGVTPVLWRDLPAALRPDLGSSTAPIAACWACRWRIRPLSPAQRKRLAELVADDRSAEAALLRAPSLPHATWLQDNEHRHALRHQWEQLFTHFDVLLSPVAPTPAFAHQHQEPKEERRFPVAYADGMRRLGFRELFNWAGLPVLPGLPATSFPAGPGRRRAARQCPGRGSVSRGPHHDRFAHAFELAHGGFVAPPLHSLEVVA